MVHTKIKKYINILGWTCELRAIFWGLNFIFHEIFHSQYTRSTSKNFLSVSVVTPENSKQLLQKKLHSLKVHSNKYIMLCCYGLTYSFGRFLLCVFRLSNMTIHYTSKCNTSASHCLLLLLLLKSRGTSKEMTKKIVVIRILSSQTISYWLFSLSTFFCPQNSFKTIFMIIAIIGRGEMNDSFLFRAATKKTQIKMFTIRYWAVNEK